MRRMSAQESGWADAARHRYDWDAETIGPHLGILAYVVRCLIRFHGFQASDESGQLSPQIGLIGLSSAAESELIGYSLYIAHVRFGRETLSGEFKRTYRMFAGGDEWSFCLGKDWLDKCADFAKDFRTLAHKSLNHQRRVPARVRYEVLQRDDATCQLCGRRPPEVRVHVDHLLPVSWRGRLRPSDNPADDYQVLCEECNIGKGNLGWLLDD